MGKIRKVILILILGLYLGGCTGGSVVDQTEYTVSGRVVDSNNLGIANVTLVFDKGFGIATTDFNGNWSKDGISGRVNIRPSKDNFTFL